MKKIVLATDFSKGSEKALEVAVQVAKRNLSQIVLLHTYSPTYTDPSLPGHLMVEIEQNREKELTTKLVSLARETQEKGVITSYRLMMKTVAEGINELVADEEVDFAVLGKTGEAGFFDKLIGSTAENVINKIKIPLLLVPENVESTKIDQLFYATQLEYDERELLGEVFKFADKISANVELINIRSDRQLDLKNDKEIIEELKVTFPNRKIFITSFVAKNVEKTILEHSTSIPNSALVLATHHRDLFDSLLNPSMSKRIISRTEVITLIYHFD